MWRLFCLKLRQLLDNGYTFGTSSLCEWNQVFSKKVSGNFLFGLTFYLYLLL